MATDSDPPDEPQTPEQRRISKLEKRVAVIEGDVAVIEGAIGRPADPIAKTPATGVVGAVVCIQAAVDGVQTAVEALTAELKSEKTSRAERRAFWARIGWGLGLPVGVSALLGAGALVMRFLLGLHH